MALGILALCVTQLGVYLRMAIPTEDVTGGGKMAN